MRFLTLIALLALACAPLLISCAPRLNGVVVTKERQAEADKLCRACNPPQTGAGAPMQQAALIPYLLCQSAAIGQCRGFLGLPKERLLGN